MGEDVEAIRCDALVIEPKLRRWAENARSLAGEDLARDAADLISKMREMLPASAPNRGAAGTDAGMGGADG